MTTTTCAKHYDSGCPHLINRNIRPLTDIELEKLIALRSFLIREIKPNLLESLLDVGCINNAHMSAITKHETGAARNKQLLDILKKRSLPQYKQFMNCLSETGQHHVVQQMEDYRG